MLLEWFGLVEDGKELELELLEVGEEGIINGLRKSPPPSSAS
jgi:hypothetical protein